MRHLVLSLAGILLLTSATATAQRREYFTEAELDTIRDAQGLKARVPAYFTLADKRLAALGVKEKTEKEQEQERKAQEQFDKRVRDAQKAGRTPPKTFETPDSYLLDFTKPELFRGYIQALDEVMSNIDDAYNRRLDVRDALEEFEKYCSEQLALLKEFQPKTDAESTAMEDAVETTERALADAQAALEIVPKTEKSIQR